MTGEDSARVFRRTIEQLVRRQNEQDRYINNVLKPREVGGGYTPGSTEREWTSVNAINAVGVRPATAVVWGTSLAYQFNDNQEREVQYNLLVPQWMDRAQDTQLCFGWSSGAVSLDADWEIDYLFTAPGESVLAAASSQNDIFESAAVADGLVVSSFNVAGGTIGADVLCVHCTLRRDGNDPLDTLGDTAELHGVALQGIVA